MSYDLTMPESSDATAGGSRRLEHAVLSAGELALFSAFGRERTFGPGELVFERGQVQTQMYVCLEGEVDLDFGGDLIVKRIGPGEFFGELGLLIGGHARSADARAAKACKLIELAHEDFERLVSHDPVVTAHFLRGAIVRVVHSERSLIHQLRRRNHEMELALESLDATSRLLDQSEALAGTDELTGLHNRRGLTSYLRACQNNGERPGLGLLLIDCDKFKRVNDRFGHVVGDHVLQNVAKAIRTQTREADFACRLGGDEFCVLVQADSAEKLFGFAQALLEAVRVDLAQAGEVPHICPVSIGISLIEADSGWSDWYVRADHALYEAKRLGGDRLYGGAVFPSASA
ncbi:diguanylate cyclase (GGDEF) domain-containing protein [Pseudoxanthomonas sp. GM95]|uniref:GGDEF domain-containing protein n=1 Tax=Pseudoxanthomonas sp. GM95 TaxID=1881043 RepID=UPI0008C25610|nr:GGDEF domain-containing protein [Pseudoxanthomonas sp. GM95]SEL93492.1 diguanylate cyclase (GGDEF) domain-containing protein [Pseudoxanthomonas sp. GM95]